jgi:hypothetical protein
MKALSLQPTDWPVVVLLSMLLACGGDTSPPDAGTPPGPDAGIDAGPDPDAGTDAERDGGDRPPIPDTTPGPDLNDETFWLDEDGDGIPDRFDNCPQVPNPLQEDVDADRVGDACDNCPRAFNPAQEDSVGDGVGDACREALCESAVFCTPPGDGPALCCAAGQECLEGACVDLCPAGIRCSGTCCEAGALCISDVCLPIGEACTSDAACPFDAFCDPALGRCLRFAETLTCIRPGDFDVFAPEPFWHWNGITVDGERFANVINTPLVADVDRDGVPEVLVAAYSTALNRAIFVAIDGATGETAYVNSGFRLLAARHFAVGNLDDDPGLEIALSIAGPGPTETGSLAVLDDFASCPEPTPANNHCLLWRTQAPSFSSVNSGTALALHDMNGDGQPEIISGNQIFDSRTGQILVAGAPGTSSGRGQFSSDIPIVADLDEDGLPELLAGNCVYRPDFEEGTLEAVWCSSAFQNGFSGVADLVGDDGIPEVVVVSLSELYILDSRNGDLLFQLDVPGLGHGGAPNIADFDGDGRPEIGVANDACYTVFDLDCMDSATASGPGCVRPVFPACTPGLNCFDASACRLVTNDDGVPIGTGRGILWSVDTQDISSSTTGSTVFDFQGDGRAEILYNDECRFLALDGQTGRPYLRLYNSSRTATEYPIVVDVDGDLRSEIVFVANSDEFERDCAATIARRPDLFPDCAPENPERPPFCATGSQGVFALRDPNDSWVRTRAIWNQHAYSITNVADDGSIPSPEQPVWTSFNTYRGNRQGQALLAAPDLLISNARADNSQCPFEQRIRVQVANEGDLTMPRGVPVSVFSTDGELLAASETVEAVPPGGSTAVEPVRFGPMAEHGTFVVRVGDPDGSVELPLECSEDNNVLTLEVPCLCQIEICDGIDNNCDGIIDDAGCLECQLFGQACATGEDCCDGFCTAGRCGPPCRPNRVTCRQDSDCCEGICDIDPATGQGLCIGR